MNTYIKVLDNYLKIHPKAKQWLWFIFLWISGLATIATVAYLLKIIIRSI